MTQNGKAAQPPFNQNAPAMPPGATGAAPGYQVDAGRVIYHLTQINAKQAHEIALLTAALENQNQNPRGATQNGK